MLMNALFSTVCDFLEIVQKYLSISNGNKYKNKNSWTCIKNDYIVLEVVARRNEWASSRISVTCVVQRKIRAKTFQSRIISSSSSSRRSNRECSNSSAKSGGIKSSLVGLVPVRILSVYLQQTRPRPRSSIYICVVCNTHVEVRVDHSGFRSFTQQVQQFSTSFLILFLFPVRPLSFSYFFLILILILILLPLPLLLLLFRCTTILLLLLRLLCSVTHSVPVYAFLYLWEPTPTSPPPFIRKPCRISRSHFALRLCTYNTLCTASHPPSRDVKAYVATVHQQGSSTNVYSPFSSCAQPKKYKMPRKGSCGFAKYVALFTLT